MLPITHQVTATLQEGEPFTMSGEKEATPAFFTPLVDSQLINREGTWHRMIRMSPWKFDHVETCVETTHILKRGTKHTKTPVKSEFWSYFWGVGEYLGSELRFERSWKDCMVVGP
jgi:hypothetical protein